jgi:hypothetical protein
LACLWLSPESMISNLVVLGPETKAAQTVLKRHERQVVALAGAYCVQYGAEIQLKVIRLQILQRKQFQTSMECSKVPFPHRATSFPSEPCHIMAK